MKVKGFAWARVATDDFEASLRFHTEVLGLPVETMGDGLAILTVGTGQQLELNGRDGPGKSLTRSPVVAFEVDDLDSAGEELRAAGVELIGDVGSWNGFAWQISEAPKGTCSRSRPCRPPRGLPGAEAVARTPHRPRPTAEAACFCGEFLVRSKNGISALCKVQKDTRRAADARARAKPAEDENLLRGLNFLNFRAAPEAAPEPSPPR